MFLKITKGIGICFLSLALTGCSPKNGSYATASGTYFDTIISVNIYEAASDKQKDILAQDCISLAARYENLLSRTVEHTDIWEINHSNGQPVQCDPDTIALLQIALQYAQETHGLVDPTIGTLKSLWNFTDTHTGIVPEEEAIKEALSHVDYRKVTIQGNTVTLSDPLMQIDLGYIAKGYIADQMKAYLLESGCQSALLNLGGNVLTIGEKPIHNGFQKKYTPFTIGIQKPFDDKGVSQVKAKISNGSVVSSGNYNRYFIANDKLYHHILDLTNGYPVENELIQTTIFSQTSVEGDALSTICYLLGTEKGMAYIESLDQTEAIFMDDQDQLTFTSGIQQTDISYRNDK